VPRVDEPQRSVVISQAYEVRSQTPSTAGQLGTAPISDRAS
jgi:hypothetical protein